MARRKLRKKRIFMLILIPCLIIAAVVAIFTGNGEEKQVAGKENVTSGIHLNDTLTNSMSDSPQLEDMENKIKRYLLRWEINGAQIAVTRNDSLLYVKGFGWADMEKKQEMQPSNIMRLASVSKLLTAVGVMRLAEAGTLKLSDHVFGPKGILNDTAFTNAIKDQRYLDITVEQLLRHKAGFTTGAGDPMFSTRYIMMQNRLTTPPKIPPLRFQCPMKLSASGFFPMVLCCEKFDTLHWKAVNTLHQRFSRNIIFTATTLDLKHILSINDTAIPDPQPLWGADFMFSVAHLLTASFVLV